MANAVSEAGKHPVKKKKPYQGKSFSHLPRSVVQVLIRTHEDAPPGAIPAFTVEGNTFPQQYFNTSTLLCDRNW